MFLDSKSRSAAHVAAMIRSWRGRKLKELRIQVEEADIPESAREQLLSRVDRGVADAERYIDRNRPQIELDDRNREVLTEIDRRRQHKIDVDEQLAKMVDEFNKLMDQERFSEAIVLAKQARELDPDNPTVEMMVWKSRFAEGSDGRDVDSRSLGTGRRRCTSQCR